MKITLIKRGGIFFCGIILAVSIFINNVSADGGLVRRGILESPELTAVFIDDLAEYKKPIIQGTADSEVIKVRIIIDSQLTDEVEVKEGTFSYQSIWPLKLGEHFVYTVAIAADGRESWASNVINFFIIEPSEDSVGTMPRISATSTKTYVGVTEEKKLKIINNLKASTSLFTKYFTERGTSTTGRIVDGASIVFAVVVLALLFWIYKRNKNKDDDIDDDYNDQNNDSSFYQEPLFKEEKKNNEIDKDDDLI